jgi:hypothetical protein
MVVRTDVGCAVLSQRTSRIGKQERLGDDRETRILPRIGADERGSAEIAKIAEIAKDRRDLKTKTPPQIELQLKFGTSQKVSIGDTSVRA